MPILQVSISSGQSFGGVLAYRLAALFATYFASYYPAWEALIVTLPRELTNTIRLLLTVTTHAGK